MASSAARTRSIDRHSHRDPPRACRWQISLVQLCVRRGADAFLVKPLGSKEVQHLWQFVKQLPLQPDDGSEPAASDVASSSGNAADKCADVSDPPGDGSKAAVDSASGTLPPNSVFVCSGNGGSSGSGGGKERSAPAASSDVQPSHTVAAVTAGVAAMNASDRAAAINAAPCGGSAAVSPRSAEGSPRISPRMVGDVAQFVLEPRPPASLASARAACDGSSPDDPTVGADCKQQ